METVYLSSLNFSIKQAREKLAAAKKALVPVKNDLRTWAVGTDNYAQALDAKVKLDEQIAEAKKAIAKAERLKKNPEVLRRNLIVQTVEALACEMGFGADSVILNAWVNDTRVGNAKVVSYAQKDWKYYAKSYYTNGRGFPKIWHHVDITVNPDWDRQVEAKGLAFLGGMLTLDAKPAHRGRFRKAIALADQLDVALLEATWMRKCRGYSAENESGFIAVKRTPLGLIPATAYHSESPTAAVEGCHRKFQNLDCDDLPLDARDVPADAVATWDDAKAVGACTPGVKSWCDRVGIDHTLDSVPLIDVVRGYYQNPAREAKAIILRVLKAYPRKKAA